MESKNKQKSIIKIIRNIILSVLALVILIYVIVNIVFWNIGMPERFFEYEVLENGTVEIDYYSGPFFMLNIPETIDGKPVTSISQSLMVTEDLESINKIDSYIISVHLPDTVEEIHSFAFEYCTNLRTINIPAKLRYAGMGILSDTKVRKLVFPKGITEIGCGDDIDSYYKFTLPCANSFARMEYLREVEFPDGLKKIGNHAFSSCHSLKKVTLPDSVEEIEYCAFELSGLTEINIPKSLVKCDNSFLLTPFEKNLEKETTGDFIIFNDVLLYKYKGSDENVVIPDGIESICDLAFCTGKKIKTVEIPESVKYINRAFGSSLVESIQLPKNIKIIDNSAFYKCTALEEIIIPDSVEEIDDYAFSGCTALKKIVIPASVKEIGEHAFDGCTSLKEINIEGSPKIGEDAFKDCDSLVNKPE